MKNRDASEARSIVRKFAPSGGTGGAVAWGDVTGKPATFPPEAHSHATSEVTGLDTALSGKQDTLVSGTNIKTVNGTTLLGSGDLVVSGGGGSPLIGWFV